MIPKRLTLVSYKHPLREATPPITPGTFILTELETPNVPIEQFQKAKFIALAHRRDALVYTSDFTDVEKIMTNVTVEHIRSLKAGVRDKSRVRFTREYLMWLPHYKMVALFSAQNLAGRQAFGDLNRYARQATVMSNGKVDYAGCPVWGIRAQMMRQRTKFHAPVVRPVRQLRIINEQMPDLESLILDFRGGVLFQENFQVAEETLV